MKDFKYFRRKLALRRKARGQPCPYVYVIEHKTSKGPVSYTHLDVYKRQIWGTG